VAVDLAGAVQLAAQRADAAVLVLPSLARAGDTWLPPSVRRVLLVATDADTSLGLDALLGATAERLAVNGRRVTMVTLFEAGGGRKANQGDWNDGKTGKVQRETKAAHAA
jgi:hypothetical protein